MNEELFSYGSLRQADVQKQIIGRTIIEIPDSLDGYNTSTIELYGRTYPILITDKDHSINGVVLSISPDELAKIDEYETDAYQRVKVTLRSGKSVWVYQKPQE